MQPKIYLACPYSDESSALRNYRALVATLIAGKLIKEGNRVYSPITMGHQICRLCNMPTGWKEWEEQDLSFLTGWATHFALIQLPGWRESKGVSEELRVAERLGLGRIDFSEDWIAELRS